MGDAFPEPRSGINLDHICLVQDGNQYKLLSGKTLRMGNTKSSVHPWGYKLLMILGQAAQTALSQNNCIKKMTAPITTIAKGKKALVNNFEFAWQAGRPLSLSL